MPIESHIDDEPLFSGTHSGGAGTTLQDLTRDFRTSGVTIGVAIHNDTQVTDGNIISFTATTLISDVSFDNGDAYSIYKTAAKDTGISYIGVDKSRGWKETNKKHLNKYGWKPCDHDIDKDENGNRYNRWDRPEH